ncbi:MAG: NADH-quinone oxidoreductase subunit NuoN [Alphaproteobacteria bacterium]|nr:NADH-quinone oxidoreductase subunit NuoN [Alphaproteobacteria bacterium]MBV9153803.1 NADH-quinone oxidoreductase subunit NuoN [Alphaproteobacteria bacterium]MBV9585440.1 NADH-quinone oxidoreductase subunit NuoN [Alphaproteobacteria bacterium]
MPIVAFPGLAPAIPEVVLVCAAMALLIIGVFIGERSTRLVSWLSVAVLIATLVIAGLLGGDRQVGFYGMFVSDAFGVFMKALVLLGAAVSIIIAIHYNEEHRIARFEFPVLVLLATAGMMVMISANDLITLYLGLELQSLALYVVASFDRDSVRSTEAGLKYFVLGALASGMLLYGASLVYGFTGTTAFANIAGLFAGGAEKASVGLIFGMVFVAVGIAFKCSAVPFHMWTPDVYEGAPTPVTAFFSVAPKIAAIALFVRFLIEPLGGLLAEWRQIIVFLSVASMILGAVAAIAQSNIKRLMAYSSIGHVGYALIGLAAATPAGIRGVLVYMAIYLFMNIGTWAVILCMRHRGQMLEGISDLSGLGRTQPGLALALAIFMFALAGIPPTAGFFSKLYIFLAAIDANLVGLAVIGVVTSVVGAVYYLRIVKVMYFDEPVGTFDRPIAAELKWVLVVTAFVTMFFILLPDPIVGGAETAAASLFAR